MRTHLSYSEYQALNAGSELKLEYLNGEILAMPGAKPAHHKLCTKFTRYLDEFLEGGTCWVASEMRIYVSSVNMFCYPDVVVLCEPVSYCDDVTAENPVGIIEILSPSTESYDRNVKLPAYLSIPSVRQVLLVSQTEMKVESYPDGAIYSENDRFEFLGMNIRLLNLYSNIQLP